MASKTKLAALLQGKCPHCHEGNIFTYPIGKISKFNIMNATCPHCGIRLEPEPGFYQGAMYVGYGITITMVLVISLILYVMGDFSEWTYVIAVIVSMILIVPLNYRYSRIVYLYLIGGIKYDPNFVADSK